MTTTKIKTGTKRISNEQRSKETLSKLLKIAKELFSSQGYANTTLEDIVQRAGMTRGALYHHFKGKKGIFQAVFENVLEEISQKIIHVEKKTDNSWDKFVHCCCAFFESCVDSELQQILLIDGPAVLGWQTWRKIDEKKTIDTLRNHLSELIEQGFITSMPLEALTHLISGAINELVLWIAGSEDYQKAFDEGRYALNEFLNSLRKEGGDDTNKTDMFLVMGH
jgi:AcrR family transcriptional regulator